MLEPGASSYTTARLGPWPCRPWSGPAISLYPDSSNAPQQLSTPKPHTQM